ncbi:GNAT family N-acetyltransferase [Actinoplanes oblitus]|uniref:GNAT family N-acetyltransferase n=1 Tax=Actinoplanes oblitus TaxID=3040509 RepID=A0ABY8W5Z7_9ACTN|nr:GNAT family N-acetyltransferase [Actinoplanes oblitus]WIM92581.1 GNAT family N-acetyltransferase [Actinoplanes oblitus]
MIELSAGLPPATLDAIAGLERRVVAADGGRLKLEWEALRGRGGQRAEDVLWWEGDRLLGFLGVYSHSAPTLELTGMVDPAARRRGIGTALLDAGLQLCARREHSAVQLVVPRSSAGGRVLAQRRGGKLEGSEHALRLPGEPVEVPADPRVTIRAAVPADQQAVREVSLRAFGWAPAATAAFDPHTLVVERDGALIGTIRLIPEPGGAGIYGFAIDPEYQGRGIGRDVLHRVCRTAATPVHLEVATGNDRALHLYTSLGFELVTTEDYYGLPGRLPMSS